MVALLKKLRNEHPKLQHLGPRSQDIERILNASGSILDVLNRCETTRALPVRTSSCWVEMRRCS